MPIRLLKGIEVNIRANGELDVADADLATLDWVVASVHNAFDTDPTGRVLAAMESPYVDCIGHVTGRKIGRRDPSPIDVERVIEKALETGTFLEINSQPDRLDLTDVHARAAREAGLKLAIDSDGHQIAALGYVELGVGQARRAWLTQGRRAQHPHLEADRAAPEAPPVTFRDDLAATSDWVAAYLETAGGAARLPRSVAGRDQGEAPGLAAGAGRAVRRRAARPRRGDRPGPDPLEPPALLRLLREHRLGAGDPRRSC